MVLIGRVVAQHIHVKADALLDQRQSDTSGADNRDGLACNLVAEERKIRMLGTPFILTDQMLTRPQLARESTEHEESELGGRFREHVGGVSEWNLVAVRVGSVDVVETDGDLRHNFELSLRWFKNLSVDLVTKSRDEAVDAALHFFDYQGFRWGFRAGVDLD